MREIKFYLADDGKIFESKHDCEEYELKNLLKEAVIVKGYIDFYDGDDNKIFDLDTIIYADYKIFKIVVWNPAGNTILKKLSDWEADYEGINSVGAWEWSDEKGEWILMRG